MRRSTSRCSWARPTSSATSKIRQTTDVLDFTPDEGYLQNPHYEWTRNDSSTIDQITYARGDGPAVRIVFEDSLPYSHVADLAIVNFITDGTEIHGTQLANALEMTNFSEIVFGEDGHDLIGGFGGDDALYGGNHDDVLDGGTGNDLLDGGAHRDDTDALIGPLSGKSPSSAARREGSSNSIRRPAGCAGIRRSVTAATRSNLATLSSAELAINDFMLV